MAEDQGKEEEKFDFTSEGEGYISLGDARVMALRHAQENPEIYGPDYQNVRLVSELVSAVDEEDYYDIKLSFRPVGRFDGSPGVEQFVISKNGTIELRQLLEFPTVEASDVGRRTSSTPTPPAVPPRLPVESGASSRRAGRMPKWLLFGGSSAIIVALIAIVVAMASGGNGADKTVAVEVTREVEVTRQVPVTVATVVEVTREVPVTVATVVEKEVPVTQEVPVTRVVEKEVPVTRVVEKEVPVTRTVPVTKIVTATPPPLCLITSEENAVTNKPGLQIVGSDSGTTYTIHFRVTNNCGQYKSSYRTTLLLLDSAGKIVSSRDLVGTSGLTAGSSRVSSGTITAPAGSGVTTYRIEIN